MEQGRGNLFTRDDTFFGVCEGLGEDLRVPSNLLRMAFAVGLFFSPVAVLATYAALGLLVLVTRLVSPRPQPAARPVEVPLAAPAVSAPEVELARAA